MVRAFTSRDSCTLPAVRCSKASQQTVAVGQTATWRKDRVMSVLALLAQPVDATQALNLSAGVANAKVLRGHSVLNQARPSALMDIESS